MSVIVKIHYDGNYVKHMYYIDTYKFIDNAQDGS